MKRSKKLLNILVMSVIMMPIILAGCNNKSNSDTQPSAQQSTKPSTGQSSEQSAPKPQKEIEITVSSDLTEFNVEKDAAAKLIFQKTGVMLKPAVISDNDTLATLKLWAASGSLPDIWATYTVEDDITRFYSWANQGIIRDIPQNLIDKYPRVKKLFEQSSVQNAVNKILGKYYAIPRPESVKGYIKTDMNGIYYRKDWMNNVGISKPPETTDELYQMLKKFTTDDPDHNGKNDTFGMTSVGLSAASFSMFGVNLESWVEDNGKWVPAWTTQGNIDALKWYRKLYQEKILDPEFIKNTWQISLQKLAKGQTGLLFRNVNEYWANRTVNTEFGQANPNISKPLEVVGLLGPIKKDANTPATWPANASSGGTEVNANVDDKKLDRILALYEFLLSDEPLNALRYGFEGKTYTMENGQPKLMIDPKTGKPFDNQETYPGVKAVSLPAWDMDGEIEGNIFSDEVKQYVKKFREEYGAVVNKENFVPKYMSTPAKDDLTISMQTVTDKFTQIIVATGDVEKMFNDFVKDCMNNKNLATAINEVNDKMKSLK